MSLCRPTTAGILSVMKWELAIKESLTLEAWNKREKGFINQKIETKISRLCTDADKIMEIKNKIINMADVDPKI